MKVSLKINGKQYDIDASPASDGGFSVSFNGRRFDTKLKGSDGKSFDILVQNKSHSIIIDGSATDGTFEATANGRKVSVEQSSGKRLQARKRSTSPLSSSSVASSSSPVSAEPGTILSPMPGTVLKIDKKTGDPVKAGERIMTVEAMKMENEIRADKDGTIKEIRVKAGSAVMAHDVLAVVE